MLKTAAYGDFDCEQSLPANANEDAYLNTPTNEVPWQSTDTLLTCDAEGGDNGGVVTFTITGGTNLVQYTGEPLPYMRTLAPNETVRFVNRYKATAESATEDDIVVTATFVENNTEWCSESEAKATAVRVSLKSEVDAPLNSCRFRHKYGIGEYVQCEISPYVASVQFVATSGCFIGSGSIRRYKCPLLGEVNGIGFASGESFYVPVTWVVEPKGVLSTEAYAHDLGIGVGKAGGIEVCARLHATPLDVSFCNISIEEVPNAGGSHEGYFADSFFMREWLHGEDQGAGNWYSVTGNNEFLSDEAGFKTSLPQLDAGGSPSADGTMGWSNGLLSWDVPCGWANADASEGDLPLRRFANDAKQLMTIDQYGTCEVRKHGKFARRNIMGQVSSGEVGAE